MKSIFMVWFLSTIAIRSESQLTYQLDCTDSSAGTVRVSISSSLLLNDSLQLVMPRSIPGNYQASNFHRFIRDVEAITSADSILKMQPDESGGPRWVLAPEGRQIKAVRYVADIGKMELGTTDLSNVSIMRKGYIGILNYTVLGWIRGTEDQPVSFRVSTFRNWPVFSTISPTEKMPLGNTGIQCRNYYELADGQTLMGPALRVKQFNSAVPLFVCGYSETAPEYIDNYGRRAIVSLELLGDYFGVIPFPHYSVIVQHVVPRAGTQGPMLAMEHLNSCTLLGDTSGISEKPDTGSRTNYIFGILHHMGHGYIPLRCYGDNYRPNVMELPPLIGNIWFNEGFTWFVCNELLPGNRVGRIIRAIAEKEIPEIKKLDLVSLSLLGSLQYGDDFRIGRALFSRGAMMAAEMDDYIKQRTNGRQSMKNAIRFLCAWSQRNKRPFAMEEFPGLLQAGTGVDVTLIYKKWLLPLQ